MQSRLRSRLILWAILALVVVALAAAGGASLASGDARSSRMPACVFRLTIAVYGTVSELAWTERSAPRLPSPADSPQPSVQRA